MLFEKQIIRTYRKMAYTRCDDTGMAFYYSSDDFEGLCRIDYPFCSSRGYKLQGYLYCFANPIPDKLIVFDHGFGGGHRSYMKEIEMLCRHGYKVLAYDHTGCMESGGEDPNGMAQSLCDLNDCIAALKKDPEYTGLDISVMGHSWGGFSTMNIAVLHPEISHVVVLSGFVSVKKLIHSFFGGLLSGYRKAVMQLEMQSNPEFVEFDGVESLRKTEVKTLLIYSDNDKMCRKDVHFDSLKKGLESRDNTEFLLVSGKGHNPNYTEDAVRYLGEYVSAKTRFAKKQPSDEAKAEFVKSWDWDRMTAQDESVWNKIFSCLDH